MKRVFDSSLSTFSIVARDPLTDDLGIIVQSKFPAVGAIVPWAQAEVGAVATQAWANSSYGPTGLELMAQGKSATETLKILIENDNKPEHRQVGIVDGNGKAATHTGEECMDWAGHIVGNGYCCQGNILAGESVVSSMAEAFESTEGDLIDRLFASLNAGQAEGGDKRGMQSAAILVVRKEGGYEGGNDRYVDVRVDEHPSPIKELERIFKIYDITLLSREDPSRLLKIDETLSVRIQEALRTLGYLETIEEKFSDTTQDALTQWIAVNNFENKARQDGTIWQSVLDYLLKDAKNHT
ncbi:MAG: DUF1028 domain-containing protein [Candidatus Thorarchaeota archaeon]|jgi:uncharacterized Ntn-hydrolase superfamily protein